MPNFWQRIASSVAVLLFALFGGCFTFLPIFVSTQNGNSILEEGSLRPKRVAEDGDGSTPTQNMSKIEYSTDCSIETGLCQQCDYDSRGAVRECRNVPMPQGNWGTSSRSHFFNKWGGPFTSGNLFFGAMATTTEALAPAVVTQLMRWL
uniref:Secreted protein n=1 Tax=Globodera pallida TaxID=36090 RepID=A0A183BI18_GLOPA